MAGVDGAAAMSHRCGELRRPHACSPPIPGAVCAITCPSRCCGRRQGKAEAEPDHRAKGGFRFGLGHADPGSNASTAPISVLQGKRQGHEQLTVSIIVSLVYRGCNDGGL